jgi:hypothetical protein
VEVGRVMRPLECVPDELIARRFKIATEINSDRRTWDSEVGVSKDWRRRSQVRACSELLCLTASVRSTKSRAFATHRSAASFCATR